MKKLFSLLVFTVFAPFYFAAAQQSQSIKTVEFTVKGMSCGNCVEKVHKAAMDVPGVLDAVVSLDKATAKITYDESKTDGKQIYTALQQTGYEIHRMGTNGNTAEMKSSETKAKKACGTSSCCKGKKAEECDEKSEKK